MDTLSRICYCVGLSLILANIYATEACYNPQWLPYPGRHSTGGVRQEGGILSVQDCLNYCANATTDCQAVDVVTSMYPPQCWVHSDTTFTLPENVYDDDQDTVQYVLTTRCSTNPPPACAQTTWDLYRGWYSFGAQKMEGPRTIQQCLDYCNRTAGCLAVDINVQEVPLSCWPHTNPDDLTIDNTYQDDPGTLLTYQYRLVRRCPTSPTTTANCYQPEWIVLPRTQSTGSTQVPGTWRSVQECLDQCGLSPGCVAVDYNKQDLTCWAYTVMPGSDELYDSTTTDQYQLVDRCSTGTTSSSTTTTATTTTTTTLPRDNTCRQSIFRKFYDQNSVGGTEVVGPRTIQQCVDRCNRTAGCVAADVVATQVPLSCWLHLGTLDDDNNYSSPGTIQFRLDFRCPNPPPAKPCYNPDWTATPGTSSTNGIRVTGPRYVQECLDVCGQNTSCVAVDFNTADNSCWLHLSQADLTAHYVDPTTTQYVLTNRCAVGDLTVPVTTTTTTTTTTTQSRDPRNCIQSVFSVTRDTNSLNAVEVTGPRTIQQCLDLCNRTTSCVGADIEVDVVPLACWLHHNAADLAEQFDAPGTVQYQLQFRCPKPAPVRPCYNPEWRVIVGQTSAYGTQVPGAVRSLQECLDLCGQNTSCVAADYSTSTRACWLHLNAADLDPSNLYESDDSSEYVLDYRCYNESLVTSSTSTSTTSTTPSTTTREGGNCYVKFVDQNSLYAVVQPGPRTIKQCIDYCNNNPSCHAVDIEMNAVPLVCWVHLAITQLANDQTFYTQGVNQYRIIARCPPTPIDQRCYNPEWTVLRNTNSVGSTRAPGVWPSVQECLDQCGKYSNCVAADYNRVEQSCWLYTDTSALASTYANDNTDQYRLTERCASNNSPATTTSIARLPSTVSSGGPCNQTVFRRFAGQNSVNGQRRDGPRTIQQCLDLCSRTAECVAADIEENSEPLVCWLHLDAADLLTVFSQTGTFQYQLVTRCPNVSRAVTGCYNPQWSNPLIDQNSVGGQQHVGSESIQQCFDACGAIPSCVAVDYNTINGECWLHTNPEGLAGLDLYDQRGTNQYRLLDRCPNETTRSVPPPDTTTTGMATAATVPPVCLPWVVTIGRNSLNGQLHMESSTLQQCLDYCMHTTGCAGVDVVLVTGACWVHTNVHDLSDLYDTPGTNQYRLNRSCIANASGQAVSIQPAKGPIAGSTRVTIMSSNINMLTIAMVVIGQERIAVTPNTQTPSSIVVLTPAMVGLPSTVNVSLVTTSGHIINTRQAFVYRNNATVTDLTPRQHLIVGGTNVSIYGTDLDAVGEARLTLTVVSSTISDDMPTIRSQVSQACSPRTGIRGTQLVCRMPRLDLTAYQELMVHVNGQGAVSGQDGSGVASLVYPDASRLDVYVGVELDGIVAYRNVSVAMPGLKMSFHDLPEVEICGLTSDAAQNVRPVEYDSRNGRSITIRGAHLLRGCEAGDYNVTIGDGICDITQLNDSAIVCQPPARRPGPGLRGSSCSGDSLPIRITVGYGSYENCACLSYMNPDDSTPTAAPTPTAEPTPTAGPTDDKDARLTRLGLGLGLGLGIPLLILCIVVLLLVCCLPRRGKPTEAFNTVFESWPGMKRGGGGTLNSAPPSDYGDSSQTHSTFGRSTYAGDSELGLTK